MSYPLRDKYIQAKALTQNRITKRHFPLTLIMNKSNLNKVIHQYKYFYIKKRVGYGGRNIFVVKCTSNQSFLLRTPNAKNIMHLPNKKRLFKILNRNHLNSYVIQQGITSRTISGDPFDIRVHTIRHREGWRIGGMLVRVTYKDDQLTDPSESGFVMQLEEFLSYHLHLKPHAVKKMKKKLINLSLQASKVISKYYPNRNQYGIDIGIDKRYKLWIYEINIANPNYKPFKMISRKIYRKLKNHNTKRT
ncbi:YheC/YheD family protein [Marininema halotolerans]|uniref:YheC/D like ATP-grasp n=1 Tax=Marininema halotolerans TaxID=1155944 RepID=A0A1I6TTZ1_9BACL|nr:YheC/YheD family protein [Marininema halotolerans]SFS92558.1 YheC/D like ATP-grasp [Marininema halotolerans]